MKSENNILDQRIELIQWISSLEDKNTIEKLIEFMKAETKDWWENIQEQEKNLFCKALKMPKVIN